MCHVHCLLCYKITRSRNELLCKAANAAYVNNGNIIRKQLRAPGLFQYPIRRLIVKSSKVSKPLYLYLESYDLSEIV